MSGIVLAVHAGAGAIRRERLGAEEEARARSALAAALSAGHALLARGGTALDAVEIAVRALEDAEVFNAGRGSVLTSAGSVQMDAALMDGRTRAAGAVAGVRRLVHPVSAARAVLEYSPHVLLAGDGAEAFARAHGAEVDEPESFITPARRAQLERAREKNRVSLDHDEDAWGTVGAVSRDADGHLAAATSTGGMTNQLPGRVGDTPLIGASTWADDASCAVSGTGHGEAFIRAAFAHEVDALMRHAQLELDAACQRALARVRALGAGGGCAAVDRAGNAALPFTTPGMYRGSIRADGRPRVAVYADDPAAV